jgi:flagellar assembly factor FliW
MMIRVVSTRFGELEIAADKVISMPGGMLGFNEKRYILLSSGTGPFCWLQAVDNPDIAFVVVDPQTAVPDFEVKLTADEYSQLGLRDNGEIVVLTVVTMDRNPLDITINLLGPIVINPETMTAIQVVFEGNRYSTRHPYFDNSLTKKYANSEHPDDAVNVNLEKLYAG